MDKKDLYPICTILYKTDNKDGWNYAIMSGTKEQCSNYCENLKKENNWYDYKCYVSYHCFEKNDISFKKIQPEAEYIHRCTDFIYNFDDDKFYYPKEIIPYPKNDTEILQDFNIIVKGAGEDDEDILLPEDEEDFEEGANISIALKDVKDKIITIADYILEDIPEFIKRLKETGYSNLSIEEYNYTKFLVWNIGNNIRFIIQNYDRDKVEIKFDKLIPDNIFYNEFQLFYSKLKNYIIKHKELYAEFEEQEKFLYSLKWVYDLTNQDIPQEYTCIEWCKTKKLKQFIKKIEQESKPEVIYCNNHEQEIYCYFFNNNYYWISGNKIIRTTSYQWQRDDIIQFVKSNNFNYEKDMSLTDVYNQLIKK